MADKKDYADELAPVQTRGEGSMYDLESYQSRPTYDAVFGEITEKGPNYRNVGWMGTAVLMTKSQIGLGVLSIPIAFETLGLIPGVFCMLAIAIITTWSDYMVGIFKLNHPDVYGMDDVGGLIFGKIGYWFLGIAFCLYWVFVAGSGMLSLSIGLNALSDHATCTAVFVAVAAIAAFLFASIRTLEKISFLAWVGLPSILSAIFTLMISVGVENRPAAAPQQGPWQSNFKLTNNPTPAEAFAALSSLVFAYAGTPAFFSIVSEMRDPRHYAKSLIICQSTVTITYLTVGIVVYYFCGSYVASPALGSAGPTMKKVCYGLALPGLMVTTLLFTHIPAKYVFVHLLRGSKHLNSNSAIHWATWLGCTLGTTVISYVIASAIPVFGGLVSLIGALLGTLLSFQPMGFMWLYDNWDKERNLKWKFMTGWSIFVIVSGTFLMVAGTYGSVVGIINSYNATGGSGIWSCADNSGST